MCGRRSYNFMKDNLIFRINQNYKSAKIKSDIDLREYANKLYIDPQYGGSNENSVINYAALSGKWDIEDVREDNSLLLTHRATGDNIIFSFKSFADKVAFAKILYPDKPVRQIGVGFNLATVI